MTETQFTENSTKFNRANFATDMTVIVASRGVHLFGIGAGRWLKAVTVVSKLH